MRAVFHDETGDHGGVRFASGGVRVEVDDEYGPVHALVTLPPTLFAARRSPRALTDDRWRELILALAERACEFAGLSRDGEPEFVRHPASSMQTTCVWSVQWCAKASAVRAIVGGAE